MSSENNIQKQVGFLFELGTLRKIVRGHNQALLTNDETDNIASHSFRVTAIGWFLARQEAADPYKVLLMCLFHDASEARSGDQNWIHKKYVKVFEKEITLDQLSGLPQEEELFRIIEEYDARETKEAIVAKDADLLDQILLLREYTLQGNREAESWLAKGKGNRPNTHVSMLQTDTAKQLAAEILRQEPGDWWKDIWTEKRR